MAIEYKTHPFDNDPEWWLRSVPEPNSWMDVNILRFLRLYESYPLLWDPTNSNYRNRVKRIVAYRRIARELKLVNIDEDECIKLVEILKQRYIAEKEFCKKNKCPPPDWFNIISRILKTIMDPQHGIKSPSFQACEGCCGKQNLIAPCCYYKGQDSSDRMAACKDCCGKQNLQPPCHRYNGSPSDDVDPDYLSENELDQDQQLRLKSHMVTRQGVEILVINLKPDSRFDSSNSDDDPCDCDDSGSKSSLQSSKSEKSGDNSELDRQDCDPCDSTSDSSSSGSVGDFRLQSVLFNALNSSSGNSTTINEDHENAVEAQRWCTELGDRPGLFEDSTRRPKGKRADLLETCAGPRDEFAVLSGLIPDSEPRRLHEPGGGCCSRHPHQPYPLQLEL
ncbi:hypothetical protein QAD02_022593 [Eretmocerus hayati]|uniref:Uncharacterized protein n=1 Tax=Eretmocerus hayati TaxID=131215 RepID=A0ACC2PT82_9HYME|nr:hypothetical protein QAD02_022593 [Eretmocerus hayati]